MRVVFVTREGYELAGARVRCYNFARMLNAAGIEARVFSFGDHLGAKCGEKEFEMSAWQKFWLNVKALKALLKEDRETVFILQRVNYHVLAPLLVVLFKRSRFILDVDDWNIREDPVYYFGFYPSSKMEYVTRCLAGRAVICIAASRFLTTYLRAYNQHTCCLPTGVDAELFLPQSGRHSGGTIFSWVGTAYHPEMGENLSFVLDCFSEVADQYSAVCLSLAGEGKYYEKIKEVVSSHRHREKITVHGWIRADDMPAYLAGIDVGLLPLIQSSRFNLGKSPTKLFEYMSMAKPVVSSDKGEARHIVRQGQTGFLAQRREQFVEAMLCLAKDGSLRSAMGQAGRGDVLARYSLRVITKELVGIIKNIDEVGP